MERQNGSTVAFRAEVVCGDHTVVEELHGVESTASALRETLLAMTRIIEMHVERRSVSVEAVITSGQQAAVAKLMLTLEVDVLERG